MRPHRSIGRRRVAGVAALTLTLTGCGRSKAPDTAAALDRITALSRQSGRDLAARHMDAVSALYARDARLLLANARTVRGRDSIAAVFRTLAADLPRFRHVFQPDSIVVARAGDLAIVTGRYRFTPDTAQAAVFDIGKSLGVWKREDGDWRIAFDMTNSDGAATAAAPGAIAAVREVVQWYLHGLKFNDVESLQHAFSPAAQLFFVDRDGHLGHLTQTQWYQGFAANAGHEEAGELRIASVTVARDIASVTVVEEYPRSRYIDYLSLVKSDEAWRIVNKVSTAEPRGP